MKLEDIANCWGPGPEMLFAVDTKSKPGKLIMHFVRFNTLCIEDDGHFDKVNVKTVKEENDLRLAQFARQVKL